MIDLKNTASISAKQSLYFWLIMKLSRYCSIGLRSNRIYNLFISERSYKYLIRNISNKFWYFHDHMLLIHKTKILFFLHLFLIYINDQTNIQPFTILSFLGYIGHLVIKLWSQSKDKSSILSFWWLLIHVKLSKNC